MKAVFFDLDNTLIDFMRMKEASVNAAVEEMISEGLKIDRDTALKEIYDIYREEGIEDTFIFQKFLMKTNKKIDYKMLSAAIVNYRRVQSGLIKPYSHVMKVLLQMHKMGLKLGIITDAPELKAWMRLTELGIQDFFDVVVAKTDDSEFKPSKQPFLKATSLLGLNPENCIMVGDSLERDIKGAQSVGMKAVLAKYGVRKDSEHDCSDYVLEDIEELIPILKSLI